jgi:hypothetical protein
MNRYTFVVFLAIEEIRLSATEDPDGLSEADAVTTLASACLIQGYGSLSSVLLLLLL